MIDATNAPIIVRLFGEPAFVEGSAHAEVRGARRAIPLLVYLATSRQQTVDRRQLADALWPDLDGDAALANLRRHLHALLSVLPRLPGGATWLRTSRFSVSIDPAATSLIDVVQFEDAIKDGDDEKAVSLYADHLAPSVSGEWAAIERNRLNRLASDALDRLIAASRGSDPARALAWTARAHELDPWRESVVRTHIEVLWALGDFGAARSFYQIFEGRLREEFGVEPDPETKLVYDRIAPTELVSRVGSLPTWSQAIIGREADLDAIGRQLSEKRLVTIVGEGGIGKTRLACLAAETFVDRFPDGVRFVDLAAISEGSLVAQRVASSFGLRLEDATDESGRCIANVGEQLMILDNCEHVVSDAARSVAMLMRSSPAARVIATSREALAIRGESVMRLAALSQSAAVDLFAAQARLRDERFAVTPLMRKRVASIARRLDYNPLAVKLAAAQLTVMTLEQLDDLLNLRLQLLSGDHLDAPIHQRGLKASLQWSYELLGGRQALFRLCGAFAGIFTLEAVIVLAGSDSPADTIRGLKALVDKCMLVSEPSSATFRMLESCKVFARQQSADLGETEELRRTLLYAMEKLFVRDFRKFVTNPRESELLNLSHFVHDVEQLLPWAIDKDSETLHSAVRLLHALTVWMDFASGLNLFSYAESMLAKLEADQLELIARAWYVIAVRANFLDLGGDSAYCLVAEANAVLTARASSNADLIADALLNRAAFNSMNGRFAEASDDFAEIDAIGPLPISRDLLKEWNTAIFCFNRRQYHEAAALLTVVAEAHERLGNRHRFGAVANMLAEVEHARGNTPLAIDLTLRALAGFNESDGNFLYATTNLVGYYVATADMLSAAASARAVLSLQRRLPSFNRAEAALLIHLAAMGALVGDFATAFALDGYVQEQSMKQSFVLGGAEEVSRGLLLSATDQKFTEDQADALRREGAARSRSSALDVAERAVIVRLQAVAVVVDDNATTATARNVS